MLGLKFLTNKIYSHRKPHALQVEKAKVELKAIQEQIKNLAIELSISQSTNLDYSNRGFNSEDVKNIKAQESSYELVSFKNNNIGYKGLQYLIHGEEGPSNLRETYEGMLTKQDVKIVKLDLSKCNIGDTGADI